MERKVMKVNSMEFKMMSETHLKVLVLQGYDIVISDKVEDNNVKPVSNNKADSKAAKPITANKTAKSSGKSKKDSKAAKPTKPENKQLAFGKNIKVGNFVKVLNLKDHHLVSAGKVKSVKDNVVELTNTRKFALDHVLSISESEFKKLAKTLKKVAKQEAKKSSTSTKLSPKDYKICYAKHLLTLGKITESDFNQVITDDKALHDIYELYAKGDEPVKLSNAEAMKIFADNAKVNA